MLVYDGFRWQRATGKEKQMTITIHTDDFGNATETLAQAAHRTATRLEYFGTSAAQLAEIDALYPYNAACRKAGVSPEYPMHPNMIGKSRPGCED